MEYNMENRGRCDKGQERNSNFELLRIIAMFMIILIHANMYLPIFCPGKSRIFYNGLVNGICNIGVTCFILIGFECKVIEGKREGCPCSRDGYFFSGTVHVICCVAAKNNS